MVRKKFIQTISRVTIFATLVYSNINKIDKNDLTVLAGTRVDVMY